MNRLQRLVSDLLEREGALVEPIEPEGLEVVAPPRLREALGVPDWCRLGFGSSLPAGAQRLGLEGDWGPATSFSPIVIRHCRMKSGRDWSRSA